MSNWFEVEIDKGDTGCFLVEGEHDWHATGMGSEGEPTGCIDTWHKVTVSKYDDDQLKWVELPKDEADAFFEANKGEVMEHVIAEAEDAYGP